ncbi:hypothetical protein [Kribbella sp. NPDC055071]
MSVPTISTDRVRSTRPRDVRTARRVAAAIVLPIPAFCIAFAQPPEYGAADTRAALDAIGAHLGAKHLAVWLGAVVMLTLVPAFLAAARLARQRRPLLAAAAALVNMAAYLGSGLGLAASDIYLETAAKPGFDRDVMARFLDAATSHGVFGLSIGLFVICHIIGAVLLGIALWGIIPRWASIVLIVSQPLHFVAFVILQNQVLDITSWALTGVGLTVCAAVVLRTSNDHWDLAPQA